MERRHNLTWGNGVIHWFHLYRCISPQQSESYGLTFGTLPTCHCFVGTFLHPGLCGTKLACIYGGLGLERGGQGLLGIFHSFQHST